MSLRVPSNVTPIGDIDVMDRVGAVINILARGESGIINLSTSNVFFQSGTLKKQLTAVEDYLKLTLTTTELYQLRASGETNFVVVNESVSPFEILWEGLLFIRSVD